MRYTPESPTSVCVARNAVCCKPELSTCSDLIRQLARQSHDLVDKMKGGGIILHPRHLIFDGTTGIYGATPLLFRSVTGLILTKEFKAVFGEKWDWTLGGHSSLTCSILIVSSHTFKDMHIFFQYVCCRQRDP